MQEKGTFKEGTPEDGDGAWLYSLLRYSIGQSEKWKGKSQAPCQKGGFILMDRQVSPETVFESVRFIYSVLRKKGLEDSKIEGILIRIANRGTTVEDRKLLQSLSDEEETDGRR